MTFGTGIVTFEIFFNLEKLFQNRCFDYQYNDRKWDFNLQIIGCVQLFKVNSWIYDQNTILFANSTLYSKLFQLNFYILNTTGSRNEIATVSITFQFRTSILLIL